MISHRGTESKGAQGGGGRSLSSSVCGSKRARRLYVVRYTGESDVRWRAVNARNADEARAQALVISHGDLVDYASVDRESGSIAVLGTIGSS